MALRLRILGAVLVSIGVLALGSPAQADLIQDVDRLSPERAYLLMNKLQARVFEPVPEGFFTDLSVSLSGGVFFVNPRDYNARLHVAQDEVDRLRTMKVNLFWKWGEGAVGLMMGGFGALNSKELGPGLYQSIAFRGMFADIGTSYKLSLADDWFIAPALGVGVIGVSVWEDTTNDNAGSTYVFRARGTAPHLLVEVPFHYRVNNVWTLSITNAAQFANISKLDRVKDKRANLPAVNLAGYYLAFGIGLNL